MSSDALIDLHRPQEEVLDHVLHYVQSEDMQLIKWSMLLHRWMNVPHIVSVTHLLPPFSCPLSERTFVDLFFSCSQQRF